MSNRSMLLIALGALLPSLASAHVGNGEAGGFLLGLAHPLGGLDHVCAMLAVGLWAAQMGGRSVWGVPLTFVGMMALGVALPLVDISLPFVEQGIALSVLLLGVLIAAAIRLPLWLSCGMVGLFALWHGHAHGAEIPVAASAMAYAAGFVLATALLHALGIAFGLGMRCLSVMSKAASAGEGAVHFAGVSIALCGVYLALA